MEKWNTRNIVKYFVIIESPALGEKEKTKKSIHSRDESDDDGDDILSLSPQFDFQLDDFDRGEKESF
jgi:hypothetical protein